MKSCLLTLSCILLSCCFAQAALLQPGDEAPLFTLSSLDDSPFVLQEALGRGPVALVFFRTTCSHCAEELPLIQQLHDEASRAGVQVVAVDVKEDPTVVAPFVQDLGLTFPVLLDTSMTVTRAYKVALIPRAFFIKQDGTIQSILGVSSFEELSLAFAQLAETFEAKQDLFLVVPSKEHETGRSLIESAKACGYGVYVWEMLVQGPLPEAVLYEHLRHPVIRCIPQDIEAYRIQRAEEDALLAFLSDGGRLLLCGNDSAKATATSDVLQYFLLTSFVADDAESLHVTGAADLPDFADLDLYLREKTPELGMIRPDLLGRESGDSVPFLYYDGGLQGADQCAALLVET